MSLIICASGKKISVRYSHDQKYNKNYQYYFDIMKSFSIIGVDDCDYINILPRNGKSDS